MNARDLWVNPAVAAEYDLTPYLCDVLCGIAQGVADRGIAERLGARYSEITYDLKCLRKRLGARNRQHLVWLAADTGLLRVASERAEMVTPERAEVVAAAQGWDAVKHDASTHKNNRCRCDVCKSANRVAQAEGRRARRAARVLVDGCLVAPLPLERHGKPSTYTNHACRCAPCTAAHTDDAQLRRARRGAW